MSAQPRSKILVIIIISLLIANIVMLAFFLMDKKEQPKAERPDRKAYIADFLKKEIGFSATQISQYDSLSRQQRDEVKKMFDNMRRKKQRVFKELGNNNFSDTSITMAANELAEEQKTFEFRTLQQIKEIRNLCTDDQRGRFDSSFYKIIGKRAERLKKNEK